MKTNELNNPPIVYVFIGDKLPIYAKYSLKMAEKNNSNRIYLITDCKLPKGLSSITKVPLSINGDIFIEESYFDDKHVNAFRSGFWNRTIQRYEVLYAFMKEYKVHSFFHAELDNLLFNIDGVNGILDTFGKGAFYPVGNQYSDYGCGSFLYINQLSVLEKFIKYVRVHSNLNDMQLLGKFHVDYPNETYSINDCLNVSSLAGLIEPYRVDCMEFGLYIFGMDPRNVNGIVMNHFIHDSNQASLVKNYNYHFINNRVVGKSENDRIGFLNLHIHSKIFKTLTKTSKFEKIINYANDENDSFIYFSLKYFLKALLRWSSIKVKNHLNF